MWRVIPEAPWPTPKAWTPLSLPRCHCGWRYEKSEVKKGSLLETSFREEVGGGCYCLQARICSTFMFGSGNKFVSAKVKSNFQYILRLKYVRSKLQSSWKSMPTHDNCPHGVCGQRLPPIQPFEFPKKKLESPNKSKTKIKAAATLVSSLKLPSPLGTKLNPIHPIGLFTYCNGLQLAFLHPQKLQKRS